MMAHLEQAYEYDIRIRLYDDRAAPDGFVLLAEDIREGVVYDKGGVKITAFEVDHTPVKPAFGYRIDYAGRSVVLSGDTRVSDNPGLIEINSELNASGSPTSPRISSSSRLTSLSLLAMKP